MNGHLLAQCGNDSLNLLLDQSLSKVPFLYSFLPDCTERPDVHFSTMGLSVGHPLSSVFSWLASNHLQYILYVFWPPRTIPHYLFIWETSWGLFSWIGAMTALICHTQWWPGAGISTDPISLSSLTVDVVTNLHLAGFCSLPLNVYRAIYTVSLVLWCIWSIFLLPNTGFDFFRALKNLEDFFLNEHNLSQKEQKDTIKICEQTLVAEDKLTYLKSTLVKTFKLK